MDILLKIIHLPLHVQNANGLAAMPGTIGDGPWKDPRWFFLRKLLKCYGAIPWNTM